MLRKLWISKGILVSTKKKQKLYKAYYLRGSSEEKLYYKRYNNLSTKMKTTAKKSYFAEELKLSSNDLVKCGKSCAKFYRVMNNNPRTLAVWKVNDSPCSNLELITHAFNDFFINVGNNLTKSIRSCYSHTSLYLKNGVPSSIVLLPPTACEVAAELKRLKANKSSGDDKIPTKFIIMAADVIAPYLSYFIDYTFSNGTFPKVLKIAKVIPIYKSGQKDNVNNYRPISLLSPLFKVIEKLIKTRSIKMGFGTQPQQKIIASIFAIISQMFR